MAYPPPFGRGRGSNHPYSFTPYGRGRGGTTRGGAQTFPRPPAVLDQTSPRFDIDGATFELIKNGSKLQRITPLENNPPTPEKHEIAGIKFYRTRGGNLLRHKEYLELEKKQMAKKTLCPKFTRTGQCTRDCRFVHDPTKLAACRTFLQKRTCPAGDHCQLSHNIRPEITPVCNYFARGNCTNSSCPYVHATLNPGAKVCEAFARLGYCDKGSECLDMHVFECPDFANNGVCKDDDCRLPHVQRAGQLRRLTGGSNDVSSNDNSDANDDADAESTAAFVGATSDAAATSAFSQQTDYIGFGE